ncbi:Ribosomal RNA small subunit methyltransferase E [Novipirellula aureliae]|uniref:Ribosomal RNA small subunit methyltransferase E n=1 Tax=Novipirellula aureliae TaxID=2527966 RepID=A0A5C6DZN0_9BACT|nr:RsmE family RNA methyltransferase [Novipirellula aureliae]TWU40359.1 Ribosomal RNA small subunit methyltransferase E [Novipirellula aureliae]
MTRRYYCPNLPPLGGEIKLDDSESQHATRVMRVKVGESITLFDGRGHEAEATISAVSRNECWCEAFVPKRVIREPATSLDLAISLPKPERCKELIERLTEIGVRKVIPIVTRHTQRPPSPALLDKLSRIMIESCKQCGRNELMVIDPVTKMETLLESEATESCRRLLAHTGQAEPLERQSDATSVLVAIGPEGGWAEAEVELAVENGFHTVSLGKLVFRVETAAVVVAARLIV